MGYYTNYSLEIQGKGPIYDRLRNEACDVYVNEDYGFTVSRLLSGDTDSVKWYDHEEDLRDFSKQYPNVLFTLMCIGEDHEMWAIHAMNGSSQKVDARISFDSPDPGVVRYIPEAELEAIRKRKAELKNSIAEMQAELDSLG